MKFINNKMLNFNLKARQMSAQGWSIFKSLNLAASLDDIVIINTF